MARQSPQPPPIPHAARPAGVGRIAALQPDMNIDDTLDPTVSTEDPLILSSVTNLLHVWSHQHKDLPANFAETLRVTSVSRQPLIVVNKDVEHISRACRERHEPYRGTTVDAGEWDTDDPLKLSALPVCTFPNLRLTEFADLPGRQSVIACDNCSAEGTTLCSICQGPGIVPCGNCAGNGRVVCNRCGGAGQHIGASGNYVQCQLCRTRGYLRCEACNGRQTVQCSTCSGQGRLQCTVCEGQQNLLQRWVLETKTEVEHQWSPILREEWPFDVESVTDDLQVISHGEWSGRTVPGSELEKLAKGDVVQKAVTLMEMPASVPADIAEESHHIENGMRMQVSATYVYDVSLECAGMTGQVIIAGRTCRVIPVRLPKHGGIASSVKFSLKNAFRALATDERPGVDRDFANAVRRHAVHISDSYSIGPKTAACLRAVATVTDRGYVFPLTGTGGCEVRMTVELDVDDDGRLLLRAEHLIGPAHRDRFAKALARSHHWLVGRLCVIDNASVTEASFAAVDVRFYDYVQPETYAATLQELAEQIVELRSDHLLS